MRIYFQILSVALVATVVHVTGCAEAQPREKTDTVVKQSLAVNHEQMRLRMRGLVEPMCGQLEQSADAIVAGTTQHDVKMAALTWKMEAVPALREALFQPNAFAAALDTMVLCDQMADYFEAGPGKKTLGLASQQAVNTCRNMEEEFNRVLESATVTGNLPKVRDYAKKWAKDHPIVGSISSRQSVLARTFDKDIDTELSAINSVAEMSTTMDDLNRKLGVLSNQLFLQARWEAERFKLQLVSELHPEQAVPLAEQALKLGAGASANADHMAATMDRLTPPIERSLEIVKDVPRLVASERENVIKAARDERIAAIEDLRKERATAISAMSEIAVRERQQALSGAEQITMKGIDYAVQRTARLGGVAIAVAVVLSLLGMLIARQLFVGHRAAESRSRNSLPDGAALRDERSIPVSPNRL